MKTLLTPQKQIDVLKNIDWKDMRDEKAGLCWGIAGALYTTIGEHVLYRYLRSYIPLFTRKNALLFGANVAGAYWFDLDKKGYNQRRKFIDWIIKNLKSL